VFFVEIAEKSNG